ncbi:excisionase family DNA-binding protein [Acetobacter musti]|uniref:Excisionase family DNA-binding protein n=1 Tax=Acetobacter musti TaxID=864732 RepID=A0ABX0JR54_9PROT|nr:excisionase family DNA-binding protein [Acetobacter musti]
MFASISSLAESVTVRRLMTVQEAASIVCCDVETVRRAIRNNQLAVYRIRGCIRIAYDDLMAYLEAMRCPAFATTNRILRKGVENGPSSGEKTVNAEDFRRERMMRKMLDKP